MKNVITLLLLAFASVLCLQAQETLDCTKKYATIANYAFGRMIDEIQYFFQKNILA